LKGSIEHITCAGFIDVTRFRDDCGPIVKKVVRATSLKKLAITLGLAGLVLGAVAMSNATAESLASTKERNDAAIPEDASKAPRAAIEDLSRAVLLDNRQQNGIWATLTVSTQGVAIVRWRDVQPHAIPSPKISGEINGRSLGVPAIVKFRDTDRHGLVFLLLDISDPRRETEIIQNKLSTIEMIGRRKPGQPMAVAFYSDELELADVEDRNIGTFANLLAVKPPRPAQVKLNRVLMQAIILASQYPGNRKGIFLLTDGYSDDALEQKALIDLAVRSGVSIYFLLTSGERTIERPQLEEIAKNTGGLIVDSSQREAFLQSPYGEFDRGGIAQFPSANRYFWDSKTQIRTVLHYSGGELVLGGQGPIPSADYTETAGYLWNEYPLYLISGCVAIVVVIVGCVFLSSSKLTVKKEKAEAEVSKVGDRSEEKLGREIEEVETIPSCEEMWTILREQLRPRLPIDHNCWTPAELAAHVTNQFRDPRVQQFVEQYYYPRVYGKEHGSLSDNEALTLVRNI